MKRNKKYNIRTKKHQSHSGNSHGYSKAKPNNHQWYKNHNVQWVNKQQPVINLNHQIYNKSHNNNTKVNNHQNSQCFIYRYVKVQ